ncbi:MAG: hypothetical protein NTW21_31345 [Verrucomicrobia bacterium]|nr:hypothetical protein [Verrucomicrobiota bacterium]
MSAPIFTHDVFLGHLSKDKAVLRDVTGASSRQAVQGMSRPLKICRTPLPHRPKRPP